jgi:carboxypeptidase Q
MNLRFFLGSFLITACSLSANAQSFTVNDPVLKNIWSEGMSKSQLKENAQILMDSYGARLTGTPQQKAAQQWLMSKYNSWGITSRLENFGTWKGWERGVTHIDLVEPRVRSLEGQMLAWSAPTKGAITANTIILPDLADSLAYVNWFKESKGKIVLVSPEQITCRPDTNYKGFALPATFAAMQKERTDIEQNWRARLKKSGLTVDKLFLALEDAGAAGIVVSLWNKAWGVTRIFGTNNEKIPVVQLSCEDYGLVYRMTERNQSPKLRIEAQSKYLGEVPIGNVIAEIKGSTKPNEYVMMSAHFDSWDGASGATDNGTGTLVMMEAMRILKQVYPNPKRTILVGHWNSEEQGLNGSRAYTEDHPEVVKGLQSLFNQDNGTGRIERISAGGLMSAAPYFAKMLSKLPSEFVNQIQFNPQGSPAGGGSDNASFACYGAPAFGLSSLNWEYFSYTWHTNRDTYDKIVFDEVRSNAVLVAMLVYLACEEPEFLARDRRVMPTGRNGQPDAWPACVPAKRKFSYVPRVMENQ